MTPMGSLDIKGNTYTDMANGSRLQGSAYQGVALDNKMENFIRNKWNQAMMAGQNGQASWYREVFPKGLQYTGQMDRWTINGQSISGDDAIRLVENWHAQQEATQNKVPVQASQNPPPQSMPAPAPTPMYAGPGGASHVPPAIQGLMAQSQQQPMGDQIRAMARPGDVQGQPNQVQQDFMRQNASQLQNDPVYGRYVQPQPSNGQLGQASPILGPQTFNPATGTVSHKTQQPATNVGAQPIGKRAMPLQGHIQSARAMRTMNPSALKLTQSAVEAGGGYMPDFMNQFKNSLPKQSGAARQSTVKW